MFANPLWSVLLLAAPVALYWLVIRPRLETRFLDLYADIDGSWARVWARLKAFQTLWIGAVGVILTALPDLLVLITPLDFSPWLPQPWPAYTGPATSAVIVVMRAFQTKPGEDK